MLWKLSEPRAKLLAHWLAPSHPYAARFQRMRAVIEEVLSFTGDDCELDAQLRSRSMSLRAVVREIPPVFGSI
jgi:hypothetical protein